MARAMATRWRCPPDSLGHPVHHSLQLDDVGGLLDAPVHLLLVVLPEPEPEGDVVVHVHVREQRDVLEHHGDPRSFGGRLVTSRPPISMVPSVGSVSPAIVSIVVDFPHPEGPTKVTNSPSSISRVMSSTAVTSSYRFVIPSKLTDAMITP